MYDYWVPSILYELNVADAQFDCYRELLTSHN